MILNEREYRISKRALEDLTGDLSPNEGDAPDWVISAGYDAVSSEIAVLKKEISEYEELKESKNFIWECESLSELPIFLIKARIAKGLSQEDLGSKIGMKQQQIQRYEANYYKGANLNRLISIANALEVDVSCFLSSETENGLIIENDIDWSKFPVKEISKRNWLNTSLVNIEVIKDYFNITLGSSVNYAFHRKKYFGKNSPDSYALIAWQARVTQKANQEISSKQIPNFSYDESWIEEFVKLSSENESPIKAKEYLEQKGIILVVEPHLARTYLDGAALLLDSGNPVIGLTLRYDRLDNFWFVLMHELGHIFRHLHTGYTMEFFDESEVKNGDPIEQEADLFALKKLIPDELWEFCSSRFTMTEEAVLVDAQRLDINPAIIAGRIRRESSNYYLLTELVGNGEVRKYFQGDGYDIA